MLKKVGKRGTKSAAHVALWSRTTKNPGTILGYSVNSTHSSVCSYCSLICLLHTACFASMLICLLTRSLTHSRAARKVNDRMSHAQHLADLNHSE